MTVDQALNIHNLVIWLSNGALALFGIFAGRISCNKRPHTQYLLLQDKPSSQDSLSSCPFIFVSTCVIVRGLNSSPEESEHWILQSLILNE